MVFNFYHLETCDTVLWVLLLFHDLLDQLKEETSSKKVLFLYIQGVPVLVPPTNEHGDRYLNKLNHHTESNKNFL